VPLLIVYSTGFGIIKYSEGYIFLTKQGSKPNKLFDPPATCSVHYHSHSLAMAILD
jgi:hypothetical protein